MINAYFKRNNGVIEGIKISGHAKYDDYGKDIVCAGVSASLITTVNAILSFDKNAIEYNDGNNFELKNIKQDNVTNTLLDNLYRTLKEIENTYKNNIKVKED